MFNFPNTPNLGDAYQPVGGPMYQWDGEKWLMAGSALIQTPAYDRRNRIVNPAMQISQEITRGTAVLTTAFYICDQWFHTWVTSGTPVSSTNNTYITDDPEVDYAIRLNSTVADAAVGAGDYYRASQWLEGTKIADFNWGTPLAKPAVLRFTAYSQIAGTFYASIRNFAGNASFVKKCVIAANTTTKYVIPIPACTIGTWAGASPDTSAVCQPSFTVMAGSTWHAPVDAAWSPGNYFAMADISNWLGVSGQSFLFTNVGLYLDPLGTGLPPAWETPDFAQELQAAQRYWQKTFTLFSGMVTSTGQYYGIGSLAVIPRTAPIFSGVNSGNASFPATVGSFTYVAGGVYEGRIANASSTGVFDTNVIVNARM